MKRKKYSETDIAQVVVDYLESKDWDVYQEVQFQNYGGVADIAAVKDNQLWIIETKISLTFSVLAQAEKWFCHYRSIAVLRSIRSKDHGRNMAYRVCRSFLNLGVMEISPDCGDIYVVVPPPLQTGVDQTVKRQLDILSPLHKEYSKAGSSGSGHLTPFKYTLILVKEFITENPGCTMNEIIEQIDKGHYSSIESAKNNLRQALYNWVNWCEVNWDSDKRANVYKLREDENH